MTWHVLLVNRDRLASALAGIRSTGGTIISCCPCSAAVRVEWTTVS